MARESNLSTLTESEKSALIADFNAGDAGDREALASAMGYASEKSLRNSMASMWGKNIFITSRNTAPQAMKESLESIKAKSVPLKFISLWSSMSSFVDGMPPSILLDTGEINIKSCTWLQESFDSENPNPFIVSIQSWPKSELESILLLLNVENKEMKAARLSREQAELEADRKRVEALEAKGFIVIGASSKTERMVNYHSSITAEIDKEIERLKGKPDVDVVKEVSRKLEVSGRGHANMVKSFQVLENQYDKTIKNLTSEIERLKAYSQTCLQVDGRLQTAIERIGKLLPSEPKKPALTDVQQAAIAAMVAAGLTDAQARTALGV